MPGVSSQVLRMGIGSLIKPKANKEDEMKAIFMREYPRIKRYSFGYVRDMEEAVDIAQEAMSRLWSSWDSIKEPEARIKYLYTTVRNLCISRLREKKKEDESLNEYYKMREFYCSEDPLVSEKKVAILNRVLTEIPNETERELVRMYYYDESITTRELAERLNIPFGTITVTLKRARGKLLKLLLMEFAKEGLI